MSSNDFAGICIGSIILIAIEAIGLVVYWYLHNIQENIKIKREHEEWKNRRKEDETV
jgi:hypothetical protein